MKQTLIMMFGLIGIILIPQLATGQQQINKLSGCMQVQPEENFVRAKVTYQYINGQEAKSQLAFYLDKHLKVIHLECRKLKEFSLKSDKNSPLADLMNTLSIQLQEPLKENEAVTIELSYREICH